MSSSLAAMSDRDALLIRIGQLEAEKRQLEAENLEWKQKHARLRKRCDEAASFIEGFIIPHVARMGGHAPRRDLLSRFEDLIF